MKHKNKQGLVGLRVFGWLVLVALTLVAAWALPEPLKPLAAAGFGLVTILVIQGRALTVGRKLRYVWDGAGITSTSYRYDSKGNRLSVEVRPNILKAQWDRQQQCLTFLVHPNPGKTQQQIIDCGEAIRAHLRAEVVTANVEKRGLVRFLVFYRDPLESVHRIDPAREVPAGWAL